MNVAAMTDTLVVTVALFPLVPMCRNVREGESVLIMTYVNVSRSGLEMTVRSTLVHLSTTARVTDAVRHFTNVTAIQAGQESAALSLTAQALTIALVKASVLLVIRVSATRDSKAQTVAK